MTYREGTNLSESHTQRTVSGHICAFSRYVLFPLRSACLAADELIEVAYGLHLMLKLDLDTDLILKIHEKLYGVKRVDTELGELALRLYGRNVASCALRNDLSDRIKVHN